MCPAAVLAPAFSAAIDMPRLRARTVEDDETDSLEGARLTMPVLLRPTRSTRGRTRNAREDLGAIPGDGAGAGGAPLPPLR
eukprot:585668-Pyramimonas_sp.AAC.1